MKTFAAFSLAIALLMLTSCNPAQPDETHGLYTGGDVTQADVDKALQTAKSEGKFLMVEFGADWCVDCVVLARTLEEGGTKEYFQQHFVVLKVDVGKFDRNHAIAKALDVELKGIPTAAFFAPDGSRIGATNKMELEPSSKYGSKQILPFLKEIAERKLITNPAQYQ